MSKCQYVARDVEVVECNSRVLSVSASDRRVFVVRSSRQ